MTDLVKLIFESAGMLTTVQDLGRHGYQQLGVPVGGALDKSAAELANRLVGNHLNEPVLEITVIGPKVRFANASCTVAITGADISPMVDGKTIQHSRPFKILPGQQLSFGKLISGCRAYMAVSGSWKLNSWLGSRSAFLQNSRNILPDHVIRKAQTLFVDTRVNNMSEIIKDDDIPLPQLFQSPFGIRIIPGPEYRSMGRSTINHLLTAEHIVSNDCSRMGIRLSTPLEGVAFSKGLISSPVVPGTIQVTQSGQSIILLNDAQTTGGYYRVANVISRDMDTLAQVKPGDRIRFELQNIDQVRNI